MSGALAHSPADVIGKLLVDLGLGSATMTANWAVSINKDADTPDNTITTRDTSGREMDRVQQGPRTTHHGVQIRVRSASQPSGATKIRTIALALDEVYHRDVELDASTYFVESITVSGDPIPIGTEPNSKRELFTLNLLAVLREIT